MFNISGYTSAVIPPNNAIGKIASYANLFHFSLLINNVTIVTNVTCVQSAKEIISAQLYMFPWSGRYFS